MGKYYIYMYIRAKSSKYGLAGSPYYVGKGTSNRAYRYDHSVSVPKDRTKIAFYARNLTEDEALTLEEQLVFHLGRINLNTGILRNRREGGRLQDKIVVTDLHRLRLSLSLKGKLQNKTAVERRAAGLRWREGVKGIFQRSNGTWFAHITVSGKKMVLGTFATADEAKAVRIEAQINLPTRSKERKPFSGIFIGGKAGRPKIWKVFGKDKNDYIGCRQTRDEAEALRSEWLTSSVIISN